MEYESKIRKAKDKKRAHTYKHNWRQRQPWRKRKDTELKLCYPELNILFWVYSSFFHIRYVYTLKYMFGQTSVKTKCFTQRNETPNTPPYLVLVHTSCENNRLAAKIPTTITIEKLFLFLKLARELINIFTYFIRFQNRKQYFWSDESEAKDLITRRLTQISV